MSLAKKVTKFNVFGLHSCDWPDCTARIVGWLASDPTTEGWWWAKKPLPVVKLPYGKSRSPRNSDWAWSKSHRSEPLNCSLDRHRQLCSDALFHIVYVYFISVTRAVSSSLCALCRHCPFSVLFVTWRTVPIYGKGVHEISIWIGMQEHCFTGL
jgi:hypothetical protein